MIRTTALLLLTLVMTSPAFAQGSLRGRALDRDGAPLPGVEIVASNGTAQRRVTGAAGTYEFANLPAGSYTVTAALSGFVTRQRAAVAVVDGGAATLDFELCPGGLVDNDWVVPGGLREMFRAADVVACVRITETRPATSDCPDAGFLHTADVIELLKDRPVQPVLSSLAFVQDQWRQEQTPYRAGQTMIVFLTARKDRFARAFGPAGVFFIDGDKVTGWHSDVTTDGTSAAKFLAELRAFGKEPDRR